MTKTKLLAICLFLAGLVITTSCGKKGDPFIPQKAFHVSVTNLKGEWVEVGLHLTGDIPGVDHSKGAGPEVTGCRVYYAEYPKDEAPCADCPIEYRGTHDFGPEVVTRGGFSCDVPEKTKGRIYFFRVSLKGPEGSLGPPSESVQVLPSEP